MDLSTPTTRSLCHELLDKDVVFGTEQYHPNVPCLEPFSTDWLSESNVLVVLFPDSHDNILSQAVDVVGGEQLTSWWTLSRALCQSTDTGTGSATTSSYNNAVVVVAAATARLFVYRTPSLAGFARHDKGGGCNAGKFRGRALANLSRQSGIRTSVCVACGVCVCELCLSAKYLCDLWHDEIFYPTHTHIFSFHTSSLSSWLLLFHASFSGACCGHGLDWSTGRNYIGTSIAKVRKTTQLRIEKTSHAPWSVCAY
jgi:hypothetical protein